MLLRHVNYLYTSKNEQQITGHACSMKKNIQQKSQPMFVRSEQHLNVKF
jgi:hypothetical protein